MSARDRTQGRRRIHCTTPKRTGKTCTETADRKNKRKFIQIVNFKQEVIVGGSEKVPSHFCVFYTERIRGKVTKIRC